VHAKHVKEAYRLLNKSIIRVEQPDIHLDEEEEQLADEPMDLDGDNGNAPRAESEAVNGMCMYAYCFPISRVRTLSPITTSGKLAMKM
jgi:hypothetical protein